MSKLCMILLSVKLSLTPLHFLRKWALICNDLGVGIRIAYRLASAAIGGRYGFDNSLMDRLADPLHGAHGDMTALRDIRRLGFGWICALDCGEAKRSLGGWRKLLAWVTPSSRDRSKMTVESIHSLPECIRMKRFHATLLG